MAAHPPTPGWYPDPQGQPATQRYWDGDTWSPVTRPAPAGSAPVPPAARPYAEAAPRATTTPDGVPLAGIGARVVARVIDSILKSVVAFALAYRLITPAMDAFREWWDRALLAAQRGRPAPAFDVFSDVEVQRSLTQYALVSLLVAGVYTVVLLRLWGATLGKRMLGVRVRSWEHEGRLTWGQALGRWLTGEGIAAFPLFSVIWPLVNYLWPVWDRRRQAVHDKLPGTVVVSARRSVPLPPPVQAPWP